MQKRRILFLGETFRADAITWMNGLKDFGDFEIVTWELQSKSTGFSRLKRILELAKAIFNLKKTAKNFNADMVIAERATSYGFLAAISGIKPVAIAQQGISDLWPEQSPLYIFKKILQDYAFKKAELLHAWGPIMATHMQKSNVDMAKVMVLPKGINLKKFEFSNEDNNTIIKAIVTRSLQAEYHHEVILKAFALLKKQNIKFELTIVGGGILLEKLKQLTKTLDLENEVLFTGSIANSELPKHLQQSNIYISMPETEGVSASLFEAMACGVFPIVTDLPGNRSWINQHQNGILVENKNSIKLAEAILWTTKNESITRNAIIQNRKFVEENANYDINMKKIADFYHHLINNKNTI